MPRLISHPSGRWTAIEWGKLGELPPLKWYVGLQAIDNWITLYLENPKISAFDRIEKIEMRGNKYECTDKAWGIRTSVAVQFTRMSTVSRTPKLVEIFASLSDIPFDSFQKGVPHLMTFVLSRGPGTNRFRLMYAIVKTKNQIAMFSPIFGEISLNAADFVRALDPIFGFGRKKGRYNVYRLDEKSVENTITVGRLIVETKMDLPEIPPIDLSFGGLSSEPCVDDNAWFFDELAKP